MVDCDYVVFVTFVREHREQTVCFYARDRKLADALATTLSQFGKIVAIEDSYRVETAIQNVTAAHL